MAQITFTNLNRTVDGQDGESLLDVALNHDVPLAHACGGFCSCTTCHIVVQSGAECLSPIEEDEADRMESLSEKKPGSRLGCQARLIKDGPVSVEIINVDEY